MDFLTNGKQQTVNTISEKKDGAFCCLLLFDLSVVVLSSLESPFHGHRADVPPPPVQVPSGLLDGVTLSLGGTGITVMQEDLTQVEDGGDTRAVLLDVSLKLLPGNEVCFFVKSV